MFSLKGIGFVILILAHLANCQSDDSNSGESGDYEYTGDDEDDQCDKGSCDYYDDVDCAKKCHHDNFRDVTPLKKMFGDKVKTCCSGHQYYFMDYCEV